jgi:hypothetical protein
MFLRSNNHRKIQNISLLAALVFCFANAKDIVNMSAINLWGKMREMPHKRAAIKVEN